MTGNLTIQEVREELLRGDILRLKHFGWHKQAIFDMCVSDYTKEHRTSFPMKLNRFGQIINEYF